MRMWDMAAVAIATAMVFGAAASAEAQGQKGASGGLPPGVQAQVPDNIPYGSISLDQAKRVVEAALAEAAKHQWPEACAVVEGNGQLVVFERRDQTQYGSIQAAIAKAESAALYRRTTAEWAGAVAHGAAFLMQLPGVNAVPGGEPIVAGGHLLGGLGCSGGTGEQDMYIGKIGLAALGGQ
jgi:uncharacterized protein GlcG (DUF336 family)